jgi:hypothetical protein
MARLAHGPSEKNSHLVFSPQRRGSLAIYRPQCVGNGASQRWERFHIYFLLILGIGFIGAGISAMGFAVSSLGIIGVGAGAEVAAGLISIFLFLRSFGSSVPHEKI